MEVGYQHIDDFKFISRGNEYVGFIGKGMEDTLVVGGALSSGVLSMAEIERLATIPSMDELRAKIIGLLQAPGAALARVTKAYSEKEAA